MIYHQNHPDFWGVGVAEGDDDDEDDGDGDGDTFSVTPAPSFPFNLLPPANIEDMDDFADWIDDFAEDASSPIFLRAKANNLYRSSTKRGNNNFGCSFASGWVGVTVLLR